MYTCRLVLAPVFALVIDFILLLILTFSNISECLFKGIKFAMLEIKLTLAKLLQLYDVNPSENIKNPLEFIEGFPIRKHKHSVPVKLTKRNH